MSATTLDDAARKAARHLADHDRVHGTREHHNHHADDGAAGADADAPARPKPFLDRDGLDVIAIVDHVSAQGAIATAIDGRLRAYIDGVWLPDGAAEVGRRVRDALGRRFRPAHLNTVISWYQQDVPTITAEPVERYINCINGLLDWRTLELHPHSEDVPSTVQIPVRWNPDATCPAIDRFLAGAAPDDAGQFMQEVFGYLILPGNPLHRVPLFLGPGGSGRGPRCAS